MKPGRVEIPDKLIPIFQGEARYRGAYGGRGSAKSVTFAKMLAARGYAQPLKILCCRELQTSIKESVLSELVAAIKTEPWLEKVYEWGANYLRGKNGTEFIFAGLKHNFTEIKSTQGIDIVWVEEAEVVSEESWRELIPTIRAEGSEIWLTWNPKDRTSPTRTRFFLSPPKNSKIVEVNFRDNPWFPPALEEERLEDYEKRPEIYDHVWEGAILDRGLSSYFGKLSHKSERGTKGFLKDGTFIADIKGPLEVWDFPYDVGGNKVQWANRYAIGSDVSEGLGASSSTGYVFDRYTDELVACLESNTTDAYEWADMLYDLAMYYHNDKHNAILCVEKTGPGQTTVKRLKDLKARQYMVVKPDQQTGKPVQKFGWNETNNAKHELSGDLKTYLKHTEGRVRCGKLLEECDTYVRHDNGKLGHMEGFRDDHVIGAGLAIQACAMFPGPAEVTNAGSMAHQAKVTQISELGGINAVAAMEWDKLKKNNPEDGELWTETG